MVIGIDASRANNKEKTGVEWYAFFVIEEMKKIFNFQFSNFQKDTKFILYSDRPLEGELAKLPDNWESRVLRWPPRRLWTQVRMSWEMLVRPPDVLFIPAHVFPIIHPKKTVMTVHDVAAIRFPETYNWFERWYSVCSAKFAVKHLWKVIVPSQFTKSELIKTLKHKSIRTVDNVIVVPHGYAPVRMKDERTIQDMLRNFGITKPYLLSVGRLEEKKNTRRIVEAFTLLREQGQDLQLVLVGKPGVGYEKVEKAVDNCKWKEDIIVPGWVPREDVEALISRARVFVFPSLYEGFGIPVLEAFWHGVPVVASKGNSLEEVGGEAAVYADAQSSSSIAQMIQNVMNDEALATRNIAMGRERVAAFSWQKTADETFRAIIS